MIEKEIIEGIFTEYAEGKDIELADIKVNKANNIKVFFDAVGRNTTIEDCVNLSRYIESKLDRDKEDFSLTVSSSGK